ncbi:anoctamin-7-like [Eublepharis macularius]|uniref:Anoctamin n=1 Tax=Eublepharis macularius TaxID=481883 RepID=A0AA97L3R7_EUBMA|nr:anoctamin-7-like [Eublepharis macularius]XP_054838892.1 anoctamin-7-like [Eublepharis macularius]XP_054838893.1 anoctamin-7-like [Eublepharis macularius]
MQRRKIKEDGSLIRDEQNENENNYGSLSTIEIPQLNEHKSCGRSVHSTPNFFSDGNTRIDFILAWESDYPDLEEQMGKHEIQSHKRGKSLEMHRVWRRTFLNKLQKAGLRMETHVAQNPKKLVYFVLLNAPWSVLCYYAEDLRLRVPLQAVPNQAVLNWSHRLLIKLGIPNILYEEVPDLPLDYYTCRFKSNKLPWFLGSNHHDTFFSSTQRHRILYEILATTSYGDPKEGHVGVERLLSEEVFTAAFPLHDGPFKMPSEKLPSEKLPSNEMNQRQILFHYWAQWSKWKKYQPLDHIRRYFGEKIALYFAWLGFYTGWLFPAAIVGTLVFVIGIFMMFDDIPAEEICNSGGKYQMCPLCKSCPYWNISTICPMFKAGRLFDHGGTVFFSIFMSLWAVTFLEYWKRMNATLTYRWDCSEFEDIEERPRPQFTAMAPMTTKNPVTGEEEPYFPRQNRFNRIVAGSMVIVIMIAVVVMFLISIILYRAIIAVVVSRSGNFLVVASASRIASITGSVVNLIFILILSRIYLALAHFLTKWEMHRTQTMYEDAFTFKVFVFEFVNFYSSPIYIAFFKGRFVGYPGHYKKLLGIRNEDCGPGGCLIELAQELLVIMVGKQIINNVQEILIPKVKSWWHRRNLLSKNRWSKEDPEGLMNPRWERDYELLPYEGLFAEYLEMVLQFGFITIFVAACPLAPLFALLNNWVEIRLDAQKFVCEYRRPVVERAQGIGIWFNILEVITHLAVISNAFLIAFTCDFLPRLYYQYTRDSNLQGYVDFTLAYAPKSFVLENNATCRYRAYREQSGKYSLVYWNLLAIRLGFIIVFEHVVFFIARLIDMMVPDIPETVAIKVKREQYLAKQALAENKALVEAIEPTSMAQQQDP